MRGQTLELSYSEAPIDPQRLLADRKAQVERETFEGAREYILCPGGCGGKAFLENPLTLTRGGVTRTLRVAQCEGTCRHEVVSPRTGKTRSVVARFDIPCEDEKDSVASGHRSCAPESPSGTLAESDQGAELDVCYERATRSAPKTRDSGQAEHRSTGSRPKSEEMKPMEIAPLSQFARELTQALEETGLSQTEAGTCIGCSQSSVSKMLRDLPVADSTLAGARAWVTSVLGSQASHEPSPEAKHSNGPAQIYGEKKSILPTNGNGHSHSQAPKLSPSLPPESTFRAGELSPYEAVLRTLLENAAQQHLRELAGSLAENITVRVTLEWTGSEER